MAINACVTGAIAAAVLAATANIAAAQDVAAFYRGKTLTVTIGAPPRSDDDIYARLVAKHLNGHIPGKPSVITVNMADDGGHRAAAFIATEAAKDGTAIAALPPEVITAPLWLGAANAPHDPGQFIYLGSAAAENTNCFVLAEGRVRSLRDAFAGEVTMGALRAGGHTRSGPLLLDAVLGTRFRPVATYAALEDILTAIEKTEAAGACGLTLSSVSTRHPDWLPRGVLHGLVQESVTGSALASRFGIPLALEFAHSGSDRQMLALAYADEAFARPYVLPPGTPPDRIAALRQAFLDTLHDNDFLADARKASIAVEAVSGQSVTASVARLYNAPPEALERVRAALAGGEGR